MITRISPNRPTGPGPRSPMSGVWWCAPLLAALTGCPPSEGMRSDKAPPGPPRTLEDIVSTIRANADKLDRPLWGGMVHVKAHFRDDRGKRHSYNLDGNLLFRKPRNLRLHLRPGLGDEVMAIGSNAEDYWVWIEPEMHLMRWGRHRYAGQPCSGKMPVRPDQIIAALALDGLPTTEPGVIGPTLRPGKEYDVLTYIRPGTNSRTVSDRRYYVERAPPYLIRLVVFPDETGRRIMSAYLDDYRPAWQGGPLVAHRVNIRWPKDDGAFTLEATRFEGRAQIGPKAFVRPTRDELPSGIRDIKQVDAPCDK